MKSITAITFSLALVFGSFTLPGQNTPAVIKGKLPPPGITLPESDKSSLTKELADLQNEIEAARKSFSPKQSDLLPDVEIYAKAVRYALEYNEFYKTNEIAAARRFLKTGADRLSMLQKGEPDWTSKTGALARGYSSRVDGSVQPYGLVIPIEFKQYPKKPLRLDTWFHGRGDTLTELSFMDDREKKAGEFSPAGTIVLHLYGRYSNASKFAGETDFFEAMADVKKRYPIDDNKISIRGFSMGGATSWHLGAHHAGLWAGVAPGAGFVETPGYLKLKVETIPEYEQKLWHLYNATDYALNLFNTKVIAYSGEIDPQKAAADNMEAAMKKEGLPLRHIIGPKTAHKYEPAAKKQLAEEFDALANQGRNPFPDEVRFQTWTLRYNAMNWVQIDGLEEHWKEARITAKIIGQQLLQISLTNVSSLTLQFPKGFPGLEAESKVSLFINGQSLSGALKDWGLSLQSTAGKWQIASQRSPAIRKMHGLQGPIDDAFFEPFLFVHGTGTEPNKQLSEWTAREEKRAIEQWRAQFRGDARLKNDNEVSPEDMANYHLILWGTPSNNSLIARTAGKLPVQWTAKSLRVGAKEFAADRQAPVLIYPNPLNPTKYIVINSGFTFREFGSNANQTPKLPDYAILDIAQDGGPKYAGKVMAAGFFDESWSLK